MTPKNGGDPLPPIPLCRQGDRTLAKDYLATIEKALDQPGWSPNQRRRLRSLWRVWAIRADGRDTVYEQYGTMFRPPGARQATVMEMVGEKWRRLYEGQLTPKEREARRLARQRDRKRRGLWGREVRKKEE